MYYACIVAWYMLVANGCKALPCDQIRTILEFLHIIKCNIIGEMTMWSNKKQLVKNSKEQRKVKDSGRWLLSAEAGHSLE